ncbi:hypothetical protein C7974DRAFT_356440 [Boeremia exigua]|uniref:uncharacterized protein n=1 Tax=Boeremia exigua TaxID=749465 RepID=UPI001E8CC2EB|nr:uncharacterized protein C7974DRAFT_356440 [Boeremia exigua]KAH6638216.1 hypothetical protein C7974DRAFT_356440 [Boeremia exigua]
MAATASAAPVASVPDTSAGDGHNAPSRLILPFLRLPRELRDQIYNHAFNIPDKRSDRALRIERRNLKHFCPSAAALLLILHHEYFLLNRQVALEALEALFKHHTVFLSCGPFVLKLLLEAVEQHESGAQWLTWLKAIELDWVTFPDLRMYPPDRTEGRDEWWFESGGGEGHDNIEVDVDYVRGAAYNGHYDEHDHTGGYYDDNFYDPADTALYPAYTHHAPALNPNTAANDLSSLFDHNPFQDAEEAYHPTTTSHTVEDLSTKLDLLVDMEVAPLFTYFSNTTFPHLTSVTLPLYFISRESFWHRRNSRPGYTLPLKVRYWVHVAAHALCMLDASTTLAEVRVKYMPWDIWASMDSCDDLSRIVERGVWFNDPVTDGEGGEREYEGEAFRCVWDMLVERGLCAGNGGTRMGLQSSIRLVKWDGEMDSYRVGDELEVIFTKAGRHSQTEPALTE